MLHVNCVASDKSMSALQLQTSIGIKSELQRNGKESAEKCNAVALRLATCVINWVAATYKFSLVACVKYSFVATKKHHLSICQQARISTCQCDVARPGRHVKLPHTLLLSFPIFGSPLLHFCHFHTFFLLFTNVCVCFMVASKYCCCTNIITTRA